MERKYYVDYCEAGYGINTGSRWDSERMSLLHNWVHIMVGMVKTQLIFDEREDAETFCAAMNLGNKIKE